MSRSVRGPDYRQTQTQAKEPPVCEANERNARAIYELRGMAQEWRVDVPRIIQILKGDCRHEGDQK